MDSHVWTSEVFGVFFLARSLIYLELERSWSGAWSGAWRGARSSELEIGKPNVLCFKVFRFNAFQATIDVRDKALQWFSSYLSGRTQRVHINGHSSVEMTLEYGVPQGSVLGPILFTIYSRPIGAICRRHGLDYHLYADDSQLHISFRVNDAADLADVVRRITACVAEIKSFMTTMKLKLNDEKTEVVVIASPTNVHRFRLTELQIGDCTIIPNPSARNIGVIFDSEMSMRKQIISVCRAAYFQLYNLSNIRGSLTQESAETLVMSLVTSRLDYGNCLLYGAPEYLLHKLQLVQNAAARMVCRVKKREHITPILKRLHWLPVKQRIDYKILTLVFKAMHGQAPQYICALLELYQPPRRLRSSAMNMLVEPKSNIKYGQRAFSAAAPRLWNSLPQELRHITSLQGFKTGLKTYLFRQAYPD